MSIIFRLALVYCVCGMISIAYGQQRAASAPKPKQSPSSKITAVTGQIRYREIFEGKVKVLTSKSHFPIELVPGGGVMVENAGSSVSLSIYGHTIVLNEKTNGWYPIPVAGNRHEQDLRKAVDNTIRTAGRQKGYAQSIHVAALLAEYGQLWLVMNMSALTDPVQRDTFIASLPPFVLTTDSEQDWDVRIAAQQETAPSPAARWRILRADGGEVGSVSPNSSTKDIAAILWQEVLWRGMRTLENQDPHPRLQLHMTLYQVEMATTTRGERKLTPLQPIDGQYVVKDKDMLMVAVTNTGQEDCRFELFDIDSAGAATSCWPRKEEQNDMLKADGKPLFIGATSDDLTDSTAVIFQVDKSAESETFKIIAVSSGATDSIAPEQWATVQVSFHVTDVK